MRRKADFHLRDIRPEHADSMCRDCFTSEEVEAVRSGLRHGVTEAQQELRRRGGTTTFRERFARD